mmetsp:Transcript_9721/g.35603  ORF Transcript_9721/g.35603 Transcript_9721/m.35603 type:complete len:389 (+) Transcript_9721:282-1448(+)
MPVSPAEEDADNSLLCDETDALDVEEVGPVAQLPLGAHSPVDRPPPDEYTEPSEDGEPYNEATCKQQSCKMISEEVRNQPESSYLTTRQAGVVDADMRADRVRWIVQQGRHVHGFNSNTIALAVNYFDRYLSLCRIQEENREWFLPMLGSAALSTAAKFEEVLTPPQADFLSGLPTRFTREYLGKTELLLLHTLEWHLLALTPFSFIDRFARACKLQDKYDDDDFRRIRARIFQIVRDSLLHHEFLRYSPSTIAMAAILLVVDNDDVEDTLLNLTMKSRKSCMREETARLELCLATFDRVLGLGRPVERERSPMSLTSTCTVFEDREDLSEPEGRSQATGSVRVEGSRKRAARALELGPNSASHMDFPSKRTRSCAARGRTDDHGACQ